MKLLGALLSKALNHKRVVVVGAGTVLASVLAVPRLFRRGLRSKQGGRPPEGRRPSTQTYGQAKGGALSAQPTRASLSSSPRRRNHKRDAVVIAVLILSMILAGMSLYRRDTTYYIAYVGIWSDKSNFHRLHVRALRKYIDELNVELHEVGLRLELKEFINEADRDGNVSVKVYEEIAANDKIVAVIDNTWGSELAFVADQICEKGIPVVAINSDKADKNYCHNAVFIGYDDGVPEKVSDFSKNILGNKEIIFVAEESYALTQKFLKEFAVSLKITPFGVKVGKRLKVSTLKVKSSKVQEDEKKELFKALDDQLQTLRERPPTVVINTHGAWGGEIIEHIDTHHRGVNILGGPYILPQRSDYKFGHNENGNRLIVFTYPHDAVTNKVYNDLETIKAGDSQVGDVPNELLFVKRCLDAVSIIRGAFNDNYTQKLRPTISRQSFIDFFRKLANNQYEARHDLYVFNKDLLLSDERTFEEYYHGTHFSYQRQLNAEGEGIPNIYFGLDDIKFSNPDIKNKSVHAEFIYWINSDDPDIADYVHFLNLKTDSRPQEFVPGKNAGVARGNRVFKMSGDFIMEVNLDKYPLDTQNLRIELAIINPEPNKFRISFDHNSLERSRRADEFVDEWDMGDFYITSDNFIARALWGGPSLEDKKLQKYRTLSVSRPIHRRLGSPLATIILPLLIIGLAAVALFYVKDSSFANVGNVGIGIFLSIVTYSIAFAQTTPRSNVLTIADKLFFVTFVAVLSIFLKVIVFNSSMVSDEVRNWTTDRAARIGHVVFGLYLLTMAAVIFGLI